MEKEEEKSEEGEANEEKGKKKTKKSGIVVNLADCQYKVVAEAGRSLGWRRQNEGVWDVRWTDCAVPPEALCCMLPHQKVNHFPGMQCLSRKNLLGQVLMQMRAQFSSDYDFFPATWLLPKDMRALREYCAGCQPGKGRTFIVKPEHQSQGRGIFLTRKPEQLPLSESCVVQRYLCKPYLIEGLKFDLRVYVLLTSVDPLRLYMYEEGLARFATEEYTAPARDNLTDVCMHLTNYAINKDNPKFIFNESKHDMTVGHKRSLSSVLQLLTDNHEDTPLFLKTMKEAIVKTVVAGLPQLQRAYRSCQPENYASNMCFELLGFDVMVTEKCMPVILEVNYTPSFSTDTPLDKHIKFNAIRDALVLIGATDKAKQRTMRLHHEAVQQRVLTGKRIKLTPEEQLSRRTAEFKKRDKYEVAHLGGYECIYPATNSDYYAPFLAHAFALDQPQLRTIPKALAKKHLFEPVRPFKSSLMEIVGPKENEMNDCIGDMVVLQSAPMLKTDQNNVQKTERKQGRAATAYTRHSEVKIRPESRKPKEKYLKEKSVVVMNTVLICDLPLKAKQLVESKPSKNSFHWKLTPKLQKG